MSKIILNRVRVAFGTKLFVTTLLSSFALGLIVSEATAQEVVSDSSNRQGQIVQRQVLVRSKSLLVSAAVVEDKLLKRPEFKQLGFAITRDESNADIILELRHDLLTKYVFSVVNAKTRIVLAGGKLSSLGGTVAGKVARRFVKEMATKSTS